MELVYFGSGAFGLPTLASLAKVHNISLIVTQPDRPAGRGKKLTPTPVAAWAAEHLPRVEVLKPERVNEASVCGRIRAVPAAAWVVIAFGQKLGRSLLEDRFAINLHASLLPRWRGAAPINRAIMAGDQATGVSVITLADRMDAGFVLGTSDPRPIEPHLTAAELHDLLAADGPEVMRRVLADYETDSLVFKEQDESLVTHAAKLSRDEAWVDFSEPAHVCCSRIHALSPKPGVTVLLEGQPIKLLRAQTRPDESKNQDKNHSAPGLLLDPALGDVACGQGTALRLLTVQPAGGKAMPWSELARGRRIGPGAALARPGPESTVGRS